MDWNTHAAGTRLALAMDPRKGIRLYSSNSRLIEPGSLSDIKTLNLQSPVTTKSRPQSTIESRYDVRGTVGAGLRRARKVDQVAMTCEEPSGQVYVQGMLTIATTCEEPSGQVIRRAMKLGQSPRRARPSKVSLRRVRILGQVATTCEEASGQVYVVRGKSSSRYDVQEPSGAGITSSRKLGQVATTCEEPLGAGLRRVRKLGQVATTCKEPSGQVYVVLGKLIKSLRRGRNRRGRFTSCEETWSNRYDVRGTVGAGLCRARTLGQVATTCEETSGQVLCPAEVKLVQVATTFEEPSWQVLSCEDTRSSRYDMRETVGAGLRHATKLGQVATTCEEPSVQVYVMRGNLVKLLRRVRNRRGRFTSCEETWSSRYDVRGTVGAGLRRVRKLGQVATTCEEPSGQVYVVRGNLVKSLRRARNHRGKFTSRYDVRGTIGEGLRRAGKVDQVATTCEEPSGQVYVVQGNLVKSLRRGGTVRAGLCRARTLGQVATTCEEPSGQVYVMLGKLIKSLRRARNRWGRFTSCEDTWSSRYETFPFLSEDPVRACLCPVRKLGQVVTTCEEPSGQFYVVRGNLVKSIRRARNCRGRFTSCEETWSSRYDLRGTVGAGLRRARKVDQVATTCEEPSGQVYVVRGNLVKSLRRVRNHQGRFMSCEDTWSSRYDVRGTVRAGLRHARKLGQVATTYEEPLGRVYVVQGHLDKSLRRARNRQGSRYDVRGTIGAGLCRARKLGQVTTTCEEPSGQVYVVRGHLVKSLRRLRRAKKVDQVATGQVAIDVVGTNIGQVYVKARTLWSSRTTLRGTVGAGLRHDRKVDQVTTTCEEPLGQVYVVRGHLFKSLRRARNCQGRFMSCEETWSCRYDLRGTVGEGLRRARKLGQVRLRSHAINRCRYDVRGTVRTGLRRARKLGQVATTCAEPLGQVYVVRGHLVKSLRCLRRARKLGQVATTCEEPSGQVYVVRDTWPSRYRRVREPSGQVTSYVRGTVGVGLRSDDETGQVAMTVRVEPLGQGLRCARKQSRASLRRARKISLKSLRRRGKEPVRAGKLGKSLRRGEPSGPWFMSCKDRLRSGRYGVRENRQRTGLVVRRKLGHVRFECDGTVGKFYVMRGKLVKSEYDRALGFSHARKVDIATDMGGTVRGKISRARKLGRKSYDRQVYANARKLGHVATTFEKPVPWPGFVVLEDPERRCWFMLCSIYVRGETGKVGTTVRTVGAGLCTSRGTWYKSLRREGTVGARFTSCEETWTNRYDVRGTVRASLCRARTLGQVTTALENRQGRFCRARTLGQVAMTCEKPSVQVYVMRGNLLSRLRRGGTVGAVYVERGILGKVDYEVRGTVVMFYVRARNRSVQGRFMSCEDTWSSRYDERGTVGARLRHARKVDQVATTCEETSGQVYVMRGNLVKSLRHVRNRQGRFMSCEETCSSRYDVRGTVGAGLRHGRKVDQVATTCEEPSGQVYVGLGKLIKSLRRVRNRRGSRYDLRGTVKAGLCPARTLAQVAMTCEEPSRQVYVVLGKLIKLLRRDRNRRGNFTSCEETWSSWYDVRGTVRAGLRRARTLGQVATTCEEPSGQVYFARGNLVKSLRRARNHWGRFTSFEETWSSRYNVRGTVMAGLCPARTLGQVATTCEEPSGKVYIVLGKLIKSL
ncbi:hypothetical protein Tco_0480724 [Tanacetum coccineum]